jgi:hypothetical protein
MLLEWSPSIQVNLGTHGPPPPSSLRFPANSTLLYHAWPQLWPTSPVQAPPELPSCCARDECRVAVIGDDDVVGSQTGGGLVDGSFVDSAGVDVATFGLAGVAITSVKRVDTVDGAALCWMSTFAEHGNRSVVLDSLDYPHRHSIRAVQLRLSG